MIKAAAVFSNNMVLQRGKNIALWGESDESGTVRAEINGVSAEANVAISTSRISFFIYSSVVID